MRLKYQSLIALGISTVILGGCTTSGGGFLNLGVADALRKSKVGLFNKRLSYTKTPIGNTGLSLPTFGTRPTVASAPVAIDSYMVQQSAPVMTESTPAPLTTSCGCASCGGGDNVVSDEQFFMPQPHYIAPQESIVTQGSGFETIQQSPSEIVSVPSEVVSTPTDAVRNMLPEAAEQPKVNPLPLNSGGSETKSNKSNNFKDLDTEGTLEPLGQNEADDVFEIESQEEVADDQSGKDQSIFEEAELTKRSKIRFDSATSSLETDRVPSDPKPAMLTLHARPAQSHNVFNQAANKPKTLETVQASHKPYYRQQNALRQQPAKLNDRGYRQARNTNEEIDFKPLPPVSETSPAELLPPKTKLVPLKESHINQGTQSDEIQNSNTRTADASSIQTVKTAPRVPILRATTVSSASILSLKNLANVIDDTENPKRFYETNSHTAQGTTSTSVEQR